MTETRISFVFAKEVGVQLTWREVLEAIDRHMLSSSFAQEKALAELTDESDQALVTLAFSNVNDSVTKELELLAKMDSSSPNIDKLLFLLLSYLRRAETGAKQLLDILEEVYADFNYPRHMASFIRYMPIEGPDLGSKEGNESRLIANLDDYLKKGATSLSFAPSNQ